MSGVQWIGAGIIVIVTAILVLDGIAWLIRRVRQRRKPAELPDTTVRSCLGRDTIDTMQTGDKNST
jgi:hypothetical protein